MSLNDLGSWGSTQRAHVCAEWHGQYAEEKEEEEGCFSASLGEVENENGEEY